MDFWIFSKKKKKQKIIECKKNPESLIDDYSTLPTNCKSMLKLFMEK